MEKRERSGESPSSAPWQCLIQGVTRETNGVEQDRDRERKERVLEGLYAGHEHSVLPFSLETQIRSF